MTTLYVSLPSQAVSVVPSPSALPASGFNGQQYFVFSAGSFYYWNGSAWVAMMSSGIGGSGSANQVAYFSGASTVTSSPNLVFDGTNLQIGTGTAGVLGRTDGSAAAAGIVGELQTVAQTSLTTTGIGATGVYGNVTSFLLPAGEWNAYGVVTLNENGATLTSGFQVGISASPSGAGIGQFDVTILNNLISSTLDLQVTTPHVPIRIASATTYYLNTMFYYTAGTPRHAGKLTFVRRR